MGVSPISGLVTTNGRDARASFRTTYHLVGDGKGIARISALLVIQFPDGRIRRSQTVGIALISSEFDLPRSVRCQNFVESKIKLIVIELSHERRQINGSPVSNTRFHRHR